MNKQLLTVDEVSGVLGLGRTKVYELIAKGQIETVKIGSARRIPRDAVDAFVAALRSAEGGQVTDRR